MHGNGISSAPHSINNWRAKKKAGKGRDGSGLAISEGTGTSSKRRFPQKPGQPRLGLEHNTQSVSWHKFDSLAEVARLPTGILPNPNPKKLKSGGMYGRIHAHCVN